MDSAEHNYLRIAEAIKFIRQNQLKQPSLDEIAAHVNLSPFHFQRLFSEWAGTSPKKFLHYINIQYAKNILKNTKLNLLQTSVELGVSSTSRLHDLFINIEGMTPAEYRNGGRDLIIQYSYQETIFGKVIIASTTKGICYMAFLDTINAETDLFNEFPNANFILNQEKIHLEAIQFLNYDEANHIEKIKLHLKASEFQLKVWNALLKIPSSSIESYKEIANKINQPNASRAVGTAIGSNPIAYLIPCHRVIQISGGLGGYRWGEDRKLALIGFEAAKKNL